MLIPRHHVYISISGNIEDYLGSGITLVKTLMNF